MSNIIGNLGNWKAWIAGIWRAFITGSTGAIIAAVVKPEAFNFGSQLKPLVTLALGCGVYRLLEYLHDHPLPDDIPPPTPPSVKLGMILLPFMLMFSGCALFQSSTVPAPEQTFWDVMKEDAGKAGDFLKSDSAKAGAPAFFRATWKMALVGYQLSGGNAQDFATSVARPACDILASFTGGTGVSVSQIGAITRSDLSKYNPVATLISPILQWVVMSLPGDWDTARFYINAASQAGVDVCNLY
jgi:hypothetical protein